MPSMMHAVTTSQHQTALASPMGTLETHSSFKIYFAADSELILEMKYVQKPQQS
jgi:hypothetical protein